MVKCDKVKEIWYSLYKDKGNIRNNWIMINEFLNERLTIDFEEFIKFFLKKWKIALLVIGISVILFVGFSYAIGQEISAPASEEYIYYEKNLNSINQYFEHSMVMQMDPMKTYRKSIFLKNVSDNDVLESYVASMDAWEELETERNKAYVGELIIWNAEEDSDTVEVILRHITESECEQWTNYLAKEIAEYDSKIEVSVGAINIVADDQVLERQQRKYKDIDYAEGLLEASQAAYTIEVRTETAAIMGVVFGILGSAVCVFAMLVIKKNRERKENF